MKCLNLSNFSRICILVFVFIAVLGATSLSYGAKYVLTQEDTNTMFYHYINANNGNVDALYGWFNNIVMGYQDSYDILFISFHGNGRSFRITPFNFNQITSVEDVNNINYMKINFTGTTWTREGVYNGSNYSNSYNVNNNVTGSYMVGNGSQLNTQYIFYNNSFLNVTGPYQSSNVIDLNIDMFKFNMKSSSQTCKALLNDTIVESVPVYYGNGDILFGSLYDRDGYYYINDTLSMFYYDGYLWQQKLLFARTYDDDTTYYINDNSYIITYRNAGEQDYNFVLNSLYNFTNCFYVYDIMNYDQNQATAIFYIADSNTIFNSDGTIDTTSFGTGYNNQFNNLDNMINNNNNTNNVIDTITNTQTVDDIINNNLSGDVEHWGDELGYNPLENPFSAFLFELVENVYSALTVRQDVSLDFNHHNTTNWVINSRDFITPSSSVKTLVTWCLVFLWIYGNYKYYHYLISIIQTAKIDKAIAEFGTDEFYDSDIM